MQSATFKKGTSPFSQRSLDAENINSEETKKVPPYEYYQIHSSNTITNQPPLLAPKISLNFE